MALTVTWDELRNLAAFTAQNGCAISLYLNLDPSLTPTPGDADVRFNSLLDEGAKAAEARRADQTHAQRQAIRADFDRIRRYYDAEFSRDGAHGFAVFASSLDGFWRALPLTEAVDDGVRLATLLYLRPLVPLVARGEGALVAAVGRERGEIFRLRAGRLEEVEDLSVSQPRRHDQGGWSQARYQRRIDNLALGHVRAVADHLDRLVRDARGARVVVVAADETWAELSDLLSREAAAAVVGHASGEAHASPPQLLELVTPILEQRRAAEERQTVERWREEAGRNGRASAGWAATLEAASDGRVELLLYQNGTDRSVWVCPSCGRLTAVEGACPLDGTALEERPDGLDLAVHHTLRHGGAAWSLQHVRDLEPVEGIGAVLRF